MRWIGLLFLWLLVEQVIAQQGEGLYYQLTWQSFYQLPAVNTAINLRQPDYGLLDAAFFHATNEMRQQEQLALLLLHPALQQAAAYHAQAMISHDFYGHTNPYEMAYAKYDWRILAFGGQFEAMGENIAQTQTIDTPYFYGSRKQSERLYEYFNFDTGVIYLPYTYLAYARRVVADWMRSPHHRQAMLNAGFQYLGCAARLSSHPLSTKSAPFGREVQEFGGYSQPPNQVKVNEGCFRREN